MLMEPAEDKNKIPNEFLDSGTSNDEKQKVPKGSTNEGSKENEKVLNSKDDVEKPLTKKKKSSIMKPPSKKKHGKKQKKMGREKMKDGDVVRSENFAWKVSKLLGSGGFGDVYKVKKEKNKDESDYAMKTEMVVGDKRMLRLKIEVSVLKMCHEVENKQNKKHFVEFVDRGITEKFKFLVMGLVGPSLEDIRRLYLLRNYSKPTAIQCALQTLQSLRDLHDLGWIHRDIKPQNFAVGLNDTEDIIYMLDFGIARRIFKGDSKDVKQPRSKVKFLGTMRFASRACHLGKEQGRKDDLETWIFMYQDLFDDEHGLPWKRASEKAQVTQCKDKFMKNGYPKAYKIVPKDFQKIVQYVDGLGYADEPDYTYIRDMILLIAKDNHINAEKKLEWMGKLKKRRENEFRQFSSTSSDNQQSGSDESDSSGSGKKGKKKISSRSKGASQRKLKAKTKKKTTGTQE